MKLICVVSDKTYKGQDGKEYQEKYYYIECDNGTRISVKPSFKDDYKLFNLIAERK